MHNKVYNNPFNPSKPLVLEGLQYRDMEHMIKPTIHVDEFSAKMGDDADVVVISFYVRDAQAAKDLMAWFEKGYDFVMDADRSPGEIKPGRYLVYVELRRRSTVPGNVARLLDDLSSLTEHEPQDWTMTYREKDYPWSEETMAKTIPLTPNAYREESQEGLNEWRTAAGLPTRKIHQPSDLVKQLQSAAGIR
jgi:hypothetical protein